MKVKRNLIQTCLLCAVLLQAVSGGAQIVTKIAAGEDHSLFLKSDGSLWAMGRNQFGQLGDGTTNNINRPKQIVASDVTAITGGSWHTLFLKSDGSLWAMGYNEFGQLGDGTAGAYNYINSPEQIVASNVMAIAGGRLHSLFLKSDGSLWGMGNNFAGQLGDGTTNNSYAPKQIVASNVTAIAAGGYHSLFLKSDGSLWVMGYNNAGLLGDGTNSRTNRPEQIVANNVTAIAGGWSHNLFLKSNGSLWAMGLNFQGQLGDGTNNSTNRPEQIVNSNIMAVAAGEFHSLFLKSNGSLWAMGGNNYGELGDGTTNNINHPEQIVTSNVTAIAARENHSLFLKSDGSLGAMGRNQFGQLGDGTTNNINHPEQIVDPPSITTQPVSQTNYAGATVTFSVNATSLQPIFFQWMKNGTNLVNGGNLSGATNSTLTIANISDADAATYRAVVTGAYGSVTTSNAVLTVNNLPFIASQPQCQTVLAGSNVTFSATAYGAPPLVFQWHFYGTPVGSPTAGTNSSSYTLTNVGANQAGYYSVQVVNGYSSVTSSYALLTVIYPPTLALKLSAGYPQLNLYGALHSNFVVQYNTNLAGTNWMNLLALTNLSASPYQFLDPAGVVPPARFYRAFMQ